MQCTTRFDFLRVLYNDDGRRRPKREAELPITLMQDGDDHGATILDACPPGIREEQLSFVTLTAHVLTECEDSPSRLVLCVSAATCSRVGPQRVSPRHTRVVLCKIGRRP